MRLITIVRCLLVRSVFCCHSVIAVWRLYVVKKDVRCWALSLTIALLLLETVIIIVKKGGKEWQWFCPSVFFYIMSVVPSIWFLELNEIEMRITKCYNATDWEKCDLGLQQENRTLELQMNIIVPLKLSADQWIRTLEQLLLLILIVGRWLMPKGKLTHDQLSQLLLVYIGTAADIVEFFEAFKEIEVKFNLTLCISILGIWSLSLIQFCLVLTAARARQDKSGLIRRASNKKGSTNCCHADVLAIVISVSMQDVPFLVFRMLLIFRYNVLSYTNMFFTSKNTLVIALLMYRLAVIYVQRRQAHIPEISLPYDCRLSLNDNADHCGASDDCSLKSQLMNRNSLLSDKDGIVSLYRLEGANSEKSTGLIRAMPR